MATKKKKILELIEIFGLHVVCDHWHEHGFLKIHWEKSMPTTISYNVQILNELDTIDEIKEKLRTYLIEKGKYSFKLKVMKTIGKTGPELHYKDEKSIFI